MEQSIWVPGQIDPVYQDTDKTRDFPKILKFSICTIFYMFLWISYLEIQRWEWRDYHKYSAAFPVFQTNADIDRGRRPSPKIAAHWTPAAELIQVFIVNFQKKFQVVQISR